MSNMRDYADACVRYLRATGLVSISQLGKSLSIMPEKKADVEFILKTVKKEPVFIDNEQKYIEYLGNPEFPKLLTDDKNSLIEKLETALPHEKINKNLSVLELKEKLDNALLAKKKTK
ncbi:MAG: AlwI family type II restriction endonuclease [Treponema succinifaciens]|nr:MAG: AlwI family type II restriction endonuclease [Treponema succinifaciens]